MYAVSQLPFDPKRPQDYQSSCFFYFSFILSASFHPSPKKLAAEFLYSICGVDGVVFNTLSQIFSHSIQ